MSLKRLINANQKELDSIISKFDKRLQGVFKKINALSTARVAGLTNVDEVVSFDVVWRGILQESGYYNLMQRYVNSLDDLQGSISAILDEAGLLKELGKEQLQRLSAIKELQIKGIEQIGIDAGLALKQGLYNNLLAGKTKGDLVEALSTQLSGTKYESYAKTYANTSINDYRQATMNQRAEAFAEDEDIVWIYDGNDVDDVTRPFCEEILLERKAYTTSEKQEIESAPERQWNCRHFFVFITKKEAIELGYTVDGELPKDEKPQIPPTRKEFSNNKEGTEYLNKKVKKGLTDKRYFTYGDGIPVTRFKSQNRKLPASSALKEDINLAGLKPEALSVIDELTTEGNKIVAKYNIPPIRSLHTNTGKNTMANMGDGSLGVSKKYFNQFADTRTVAQLEKELGDVDKTYKALRAEYDVLYKKYNESSLTTKEFNRINNLAREMKALKKNNPAYEDLLNARKRAVISKWKVGDAPKDRPYTVDYYFKDNIDKARTTVIHEYAHHVHQNFAVTTEAQLYKPPMEKALTRIFRRRTVSPSKYADTDSQEWFAESFSLYHTGKKNLIDPLLKDFIDALEKGIIKDEATLNKWIGSNL